MAEYIERTEELMLAMNAGARAIENTKRYHGAVYTKDVFSGSPQEIPYLQAAKVLREVSPPLMWLRWCGVRTASGLRIIETGSGTVAGSFIPSRLSQKMHLNLTIFAAAVSRRWREVLTNERAPPAACAILLVRLPAEMDSTSRYFMYYFSGANRRANSYFAKLKDYRTKLIQYRVELRICSRLEWNILHRGLRMKRREGAENG